MLRPRPEPSDLAASLVPRMGDTPFAPRLDLPAGVAISGDSPRARWLRYLAGKQGAADAAEQQAIADAVEGVLP